MKQHPGQNWLSRTVQKIDAGFNGKPTDFEVDGITRHDAVLAATILADGLAYSPDDDRPLSDDYQSCLASVMHMDIGEKFEIESQLGPIAGMLFNK